VYHVFYHQRHPYTECEALSSSLTFDVSVPWPRIVGVIAEYKCEVGYHILSGSTNRTCLASLDWNGTEPTCSKDTCPNIYYQVCYNCDIVDSNCAFVTTPSTFDECRSSAIDGNYLFVEHNINSCKTFSCQVPLITFTNGSVAIFSSCYEGLIIVYERKIGS